MRLTIRFTDRPIDGLEFCPCDGTGAILEFRGVVREVEQGERIGGLLYEIYEAMAERTLRQIADELDAEYPCLTFMIVHRHGLVPVGEAAIYVRIEARHRGEAIRMLELFMNRLKNEVPIWKTGTVPC